MQSGTFSWRGASTLRSSSVDHEPYEFQPEDQPLFPGGPYTPPHPAGRRWAYALVGAWIGATATLANAAITVNLPNLAGEYGVDLATISWLPAIYVAANACANTFLVKARARFSLANVLGVLLLIYIPLIAFQFLVPGFAMQTVVRVLDGFVAACMTTASLYYIMQAVPAPARPVAVVIALGLVQLGTPMARMLPVDMLSAHGGFGQICIELALALTTLVLVRLMPLPPTPRSQPFEPLDAVTVALLLPGMLLLCGVIGQGRLGWWTETPWLGTALAFAVPLLTLALFVEARRERPLIHFGWIGTRGFLAFALVALLTRIALAEQTYGAVGLLTLGNLDNDQLRLLFVCVALATLAGIGAAALTLSERAISWQVIAACLAIAFGAWLDSHANDLTRPAQLFLSQALIGFGTSLFIGPVLLHGVLQVMRRGPAVLVTLVVVFSMTQNLGGLAGSAFLGSVQTQATHAHLLTLAEKLPDGDAEAAARVQATQRALASTLGDPAQRAQQAGASLAGSLVRQANVLAFNDVFRLVWQLALAIAGLVAGATLLSTLRSPRPR